MRWLLILLVVLSCLWEAQAMELRTVVKYVSASTVYLDAGRVDGIAAGDSVRFHRMNDFIALLTVSFVADHSASCILNESSARIRTGDTALVIISKDSEEGKPAEQDLTKHSIDKSIQTAVSKKSRESRKVNRLSGRIGFEYLVQDDRKEFNYDYSQPSLRVRARLSRINSSHYSASLRMRVRKTYRDRETSSLTNSSSSSRIYEAALRYKNPDSRFGYGFGRMIARELRGIGYLDGGYAKYEISKGVAAGVFGGTEPDLENTDFQTDVVKGGIYTSFEKMTANGGRLAATLSLAGAYEDGEINREFIYQQINYSYGSKLRLYESTEINLYRDWLKDKEDASFELANVLLNARYRMSKLLALSVSYDNRKSFYTYRARSIPDSLFDDALRQGWRGSLNTKFSHTISAE